MSERVGNGKRIAWRTWLAFAVVIIAANITHFRNYGYPAASFYDEAYYVADAQKYLHGVFFMHVHPPLGKLLIAAGEWLLRANPDDTQFLSVAAATDFPPQFSFLGYRFVPALLGWWTAGVLFFVFLAITKDRLAALLLSSLYVFDNALIVHLRGALLEAPLLFFSAVAMLAFVLVVDPSTRRWSRCGLAAACGAAAALATTSTEAGAITICFVAAAVWRWRRDWRRAAAVAGAAGAAFALAFVAVWQIHFTIATTISPHLENGGYFAASPGYRAILASGDAPSFGAFPLMLRDSLRFSALSHRNMPALDLCNPKEPGSPVWLWPIGGRAIDYRSETADGHTFRYVYLQANPAVWWIGLAAVALAIGVLTASTAMRPAWPADDDRFLLATFTGAYLLYMGTLASMRRVLYLHSYLLPLVFTFAVAASLWRAWRRSAAGPQIVALQRGVLVAVAALAVGGYAVYYPLTYYEPITNEQLQRRAIVKAWDLTCGNCPRSTSSCGAAGR